MHTLRTANATFRDSNLVLLKIIPLFLNPSKYKHIGRALLARPSAARTPVLHIRGGASGIDVTVPASASTSSLIEKKGGSAAAPASGGMKETLKVGSFFFLWYLFNIGYNIYNKKALNVLPLPWTVGLIQLSLGLLYVFPLWLTGLRKVKRQGGRSCVCICVSIL